MFSWLIQVIIFILPAYVANAVPVLFGGGAPIDFGKNFVDGKRLFGDGKTWRGLVAGIIFGFLAGAALAVIVPPQLAYGLGVQDRFFLALLLSTGALTGDLAGSFVKRRTGLPRGHPSLFLDQLPFLFFALLFAMPFHVPSAEETIFLTTLTIALHAFFNRLAHFFRLKNVPW